MVPDGSAALEAVQEEVTASDLVAEMVQPGQAMVVEEVGSRRNAVDAAMVKAPAEERSVKKRVCC